MAKRKAGLYKPGTGMPSGLELLAQVVTSWQETELDPGTPAGAKNIKENLLAGHFQPGIGSKDGPCPDESCGHTRCKNIRNTAEAICPICESRIGYYRSYMGFVANAASLDGKPMKVVLVHKICMKEVL